MAKKASIKIPRIVQLPSGSFFCRLRINGEDIPITGDSEPLVYAQAVALKTGLIKAKKKPADITLREACTKYIEGKKARISVTTKQGYEKIRDQYFQGIMDLSLPDITPDVLEDALELECERISRRGKPLSPKTIHNAYMLIVTVLHRNVRDFDTSDITLPELHHRVPVILSPDQLMPVIIGSKVELPCLLAIWLSFSMSEIRGLTKSKSLQNGKIVIRETVVDVDGKVIRKDGGKEETRTRAHDIPPYLQQLIDRVDGDIIVPMGWREISDEFNRLLQQNNLPHMTFHALRHVNASVMSALNIPTKTAQERGGWKTDYTMKQVYTHTFDAIRIESDKRINAYFEQFLGQNGNENGNENLDSKKNKAV